jgi:excisionase family DNA binding protein
MKRRLQSSTSGSEQSQRTIDSPYLTSQEAIAYLNLPSLSSLYSHIRENRLPVLRSGRALRFDKRELDAWLRGMSAIELVRQRKVSA